MVTALLIIGFGIVGILGLVVFTDEQRVKVIAQAEAKALEAEYDALPEDFDEMWDDMYGEA